MLMVRSGAILLQHCSCIVYSSVLLQSETASCMRIIALSSVPSFLMGCSPTNLGQVIPCIGCPRLRFRLERAGDSLDNEGSWEELSVSGQPNNRKEKDWLRNRRDGVARGRGDIQIYRTRAVARNCFTVQFASFSSCRVSSAESCGGATSGWMLQLVCAVMPV